MQINQIRINVACMKKIVFSHFRNTKSILTTLLTIYLYFSYLAKITVCF